jgi:glycosyltransferase involved in cell wall biosynthesis
MLASHAKKFDAVRTVSLTTKNALIRFGVPESLITIVPSFYLDHDIAAQVVTTPKKYDLVFCGRLVSNKGLMETIESLIDLPETTLCIVGDGPLKVLAERRVQDLDLQSRVMFTGWLPTPLDTAKAIASAKVLVMNSKSEGGPRVALEALSYGLPVLSTKVGVMPDVLRDGENGYFIDGSSSDLAKKASAILSDPGRLQSMTKESLKILTRFEKKSAMKVYADFLKSFRSYR